MVRISYAPERGDTRCILISTKDFKGYRVRISTLEGKMEILNSAGAVVQTYSNPSLTKLKAAAKRSINKMVSHAGSV